MTEIEVHLSIPYRYLTAMAEGLLRNPYQVAVGTTGLNFVSSQERVELLLRSFSIVTEGMAVGMCVGGGEFSSESARRQPRFLFAFTPYRVVRPQSFQALRLMLIGEGREGETQCHILLGSPPDEVGSFVGAIVSGEEIVPVRSMKIIGSGMSKIPAIDFAGKESAGAMFQRDPARWSRAIGALGEEAWRRFISLRYGIIGVGRTGSLISASLARMGVAHLSLIDPDLVEIHNLDAMDAVNAQDVGKPKVEAVAAHLRRVVDPLSVFSFPESVLSAGGIRLIKEADILICCVDNDAVRLAVGGFASIYAKPFLDIGTGIFDFNRSSRERNLEIGADIRLILPAEGCLLCWGGVANRDALGLTANRDPRAQRRTDWRHTRAGSLRSLNQVAAHLGIGLLESLIIGKLTESKWLRLEIDPQGTPSLQTLSATSIPNCPLCRVAGLGDLFTEEGLPDQR